MPGCRLSLTGECSSCGIYNPIIRGCGLMCSALPMGEEMASCRHELAEISGHLADLVRTLKDGQGLIVDAIESIATAATEQAECMREAMENTGDIAPREELQEDLA